MAQYCVEQQVNSVLLNLVHYPVSSDSFYFSLFLKLWKIHFADMQTQQTGKMRPVCQKTQPLIQPLQ